MSCPICTEQFQLTQQPKVLTCGHTFCMNCISGWFRTQQEQHSAPSGTVQCPLCRKNTSLPASGVAALPTNFALLELVEESEEFVDDGSNVSKKTCSIHTGKALDYSCETCNGELVCGQCVKSKHQQATGHHIINLLTAMERGQNEKAELQRKVLELQQRNSELTCSTSFAMSKPNPCNNNYGQTKMKTSLAEILGAKKLLKTNLSQDNSSSADSGLVSNPGQETAAVDKADGAVLDEIQNAQARLKQVSSPSSQQTPPVSTFEAISCQNPFDSSLSGKPNTLPKTFKRYRPHSVVLSPSSQQKTAVSSFEDLRGQSPSNSSLSGKPNTMPKTVLRSRPHSVMLSPRSPQNNAVNSPHLQPGWFTFGTTPPDLIPSKKPIVSPKPTARPRPDSPCLDGIFVPAGNLSRNEPLYNPSARNPRSSGPVDSHCSTDSMQPEEADTEMISARSKLAMVLRNSLQRSPPP